MKTNHSSLKSVVVFFAGIALYRFFLDTAYFNILVPIFSYSGYGDYSSNDSLLLSWLLLFSFYLIGWRIFFSKSENASCMILYILSLMAFVPFTTCVYAGILTTDLIIFFCLYWLVLLFSQSLLLKLPITRFSRLKMGYFTINDRVVKLIGILSLVLVFLISFVYTGLRLNFDLSDVYVLRLEARLFQMPLILTYLFSCTKAINPALMAYSLIKKRYFVAFLFFFTQMLSFGIDGMKATFFMPFVVLAIVFLLKEKYSTIKIMNLLLWGFTLVIVVSLAEFYLFNTYSLPSLFVRRFLFVPRHLDYCYFDFFQQNEPDFFRSSFLRHFGFVSPYAYQGITFIIGALYFNQPYMNCNNGFFSDAITNLGLYGIVVMPLILVIILRIFDKSVLHLDRRMTLAPIILAALGINSTFIFTELLTHGLFFLMLLFSFMEPESDNNAISAKSSASVIVNHNWRKI